MATITVIAAIGRNRELGKGNELLWRIPADLKHVKELTMGHLLIMGRNTYRSIGKPLPGRRMVVLTRDPSWSPEGVITASTISDAFAKAQDLDHEEVFIFGGANIYAQALQFADVLRLTLIDAEDKNADTFFPEYEALFPHVQSDEAHEYKGLTYRWVTRTRV